MEVDSKPVKVIPPGEKPDGGGGGDGGLDSDDETLRFDQDDDLYDVAADEEDAKWVAQQVRRPWQTRGFIRVSYAFATFPFQSPPRSLSEELAAGKAPG